MRVEAHTYDGECYRLCAEYYDNAWHEYAFGQIKIDDAKKFKSLYFRPWI